MPSRGGQGHERMLSSPYDQLYQDLARFMPRERLVTDPLRTLAYGTDASFYRLIPKIVAIVESEAEVVALLAACREHGTPVTFRAAGTSLSGQAISDSVLALLGDGWRGWSLSPGSSAPTRTGSSRRTDARSAPIRLPSTRRRSAGSPRTTRAGCAAAPRRTAITRSPESASSSPTAPCSTPR